MTGRVMVLVAGFALMVAPLAIAQDAKAGHKDEMRHRAPRAEMRGHAQGPHQSIERAIGRMMDRQHELNLTDDQMAALGDLRADARSILAPMREEMDAIHTEMNDESLSREDAEERMKGIHERSTASMKELHERLGDTLDADQKQMLQHGMAGHGAARHGRRGRHGRMMRRHGEDSGHKTVPDDASAES